MKHLRLRLTWLYTITASLILTLAMAGFLMLRIRETKQEQLEHFHRIWNLVSLRLPSDILISQSFLAQTEAANGAIIHIEENGVPFFYPGSWTPPTPRQTLIDQTKALAEAEGILCYSAPVSSSSLTSSLLRFQGEQGEEYYGMILVLAHRGGVRSLCLVMYLPSVLQSLKETLLVLLVLELGGIFCLFFISWHFVGWSLKPVEESRKKQAEFIAAASHELRSPLAVLRSGFSAIPSAPQNQEALLTSMDSECIRMSHLVDDMLFLASADANAWKIRPQKTDMDTLLIEIYEAFLPVCNNKQIPLRLQLPKEPLPCLLVDPERIRQILYILLDNALTYTPAGKEIHICARIASEPETSPVSSSGRFPRLSFSWFSSRLLPVSISGFPRKSSRCLLLQIKDFGCGIPEESLPYLFDRFYRVDKARSGKTHFGLGLSIAKELALLHQGSITAANNPQGGSCFSLRLPLLAPSQKLDKKSST